jgi:hypothetical protein
LLALNRARTPTTHILAASFLHRRTQDSCYIAIPEKKFIKGFGTLNIYYVDLEYIPTLYSYSSKRPDLENGDIFHEGVVLMRNNLFRKQKVY